MRYAPTTNDLMAAEWLMAVSHRWQLALRSATIAALLAIAIMLFIVVRHVDGTTPWFVVAALLAYSSLFGMYANWRMGRLMARAGYLIHGPDFEP